MSDQRNTASPSAGREGQHRLAETAAEARDEISRRAGEHAEELRHGADTAYRRAGEEAESAKDRVGHEVEDVANAFGKGASELDPNSIAGQLMRQASSTLEDVAHAIEGRSLGQMADDVAGIARRNPVAFLGAAALAGFAVSRFATARPATPGGRPVSSTGYPTTAGHSGTAGHTTAGRPAAGTLPEPTARSATQGAGPRITDPEGTIR